MGNKTFLPKLFKDKLKKHADNYNSMYEGMVRNTEGGSPTEQQSANNEIETRGSKSIHSTTEDEFNAMGHD